MYDQDHVGELRKVMTPPSDAEDEILECPVCDFSGIARGYLQPVLLLDVLGPPNLICLFQTQSFTCPVCLLSLDSIEELEMAGIDTLLYPYNQDQAKG